MVADKKQWLVVSGQKRIVVSIAHGWTPLLGGHVPGVVGEQKRIVVSIAHGWAPLLGGQVPRAE